MTNKVYIIENGLDVQGDVTFTGTLIGDGSGLSGAGVTSYNDLTDKPSLFSGSYNDLLNKPILFSGSYNDLFNVPTIPTVPTTLSSFTNDVGFITGYTETDPIYLASSWYSTTNNSSNWNTAYSWGNHATAGYLTSYTETDTLNSVTTRGNTTTNNITVADLHTTGNLQIDGNFTVSGTQNIIDTTNLAVEDNMIYLNEGSTVTNPDLGFAGNYNDGSYAHAGLFRDATDGRWKFYHQYTLEPDASAYIDITHPSFALADVQANTFIGNLTGNADTVTNGLYSSGSYSDPTWITSLAYSKLTGTPTLATVASTGSYNDLIDLPTGGGGVTVSDTAPSPASNDQLWWDSSSGRLFIYYNDGTSAQWVDASPQINGQPGAPGADGTTYTTSSIVQLGSLGIGTTASGITGEIRATNNITAYYSSDERLKENIKPIENALSKLDKIHGMSFDWSEEEIERRGGTDDYFVRKSDIGVIAQEIESVLPEAVATRPDGYKAVRYELIVPLLIQAIKEQQIQIDLLKSEILK